MEGIEDDADDCGGEGGGADGDGGEGSGGGGGGVGRRRRRGRRADAVRVHVSRVAHVTAAMSLIVAASPVGTDLATGRVHDAEMSGAMRGGCVCDARPSRAQPSSVRAGGVMEAAAVGTESDAAAMAVAAAGTAVAREAGAMTAARAVAATTAATAAVDSVKVRVRELKAASTASEGRAVAMVAAA